MVCKINAGGVDLLGNFGVMYRVQIKRKKWQWVIFMNIIDVAKSNAWNLHQTDGQVLHWLYWKWMNIPEICSLQLHSLCSLFTDLTNHIIEENQRCKSCSSQTIIICNKCNVTLHTKCFKIFIYPKSNRLCLTLCFCNITFYSSYKNKYFFHLLFFSPN